MEPVVVKTVSNFNESSLIRSLASGLVMNESFLQDVADMIIAEAKRNRKKFFIETNLQ